MPGFQHAALVSTTPSPGYRNLTCHDGARKYWMRSSEPGPTREGFAHSPGGGSDQTSSTVPASTMARTPLPVRRATGLEAAAWDVPAAGAGLRSALHASLADLHLDLADAVHVGQ